MNSGSLSDTNPHPDFSEVPGLKYLILPLFRFLGQVLIWDQCNQKMTVVLTTNHQPQSVGSPILLRILGFLPGREAKEGSPRLRGSRWSLREGLAQASPFLPWTPRPGTADMDTQCQKHATCTNRYFLDWVYTNLREIQMQSSLSASVPASIKRMLLRRSKSSHLSAVGWPPPGEGATEP